MQKKYLEANGVEEALKAAVAKAIKERPENAVSAIADFLKYPYTKAEMYMGQPLKPFTGPIKKDKGQPSIHLCLIAPSEKDDELGHLWTSHSRWMKYTHTYDPNNGDDSDMPRMVQYSIGRYKQAVDPFDIVPATTEDVCYIMVETFLAMSGLGRHMAQAGGYPDMKLKNGQQCGWHNFPTGAVPAIGAFGKYVAIGSDQIFATITDDATTVRPMVGQPGILFAFKCPKVNEAEADAIWSGHEAFMRSTHELDAKDGVKPTVTQYQIAKGFIPKNRLAPEEGMTDDMLYMVSMYFPSDASKAKHLAMVSEQDCWTKLMAAVKSANVSLDRFDGAVHVNMDQ